MTQITDSFTQQVLQLLAITPEITMMDIVEYTKVPRATAGRKVSQLVTKKIIKRRGSGRVAHYIVG